MNNQVKYQNETSKLSSFQMHFVQWKKHGFWPLGRLWFKHFEVIDLLIDLCARYSNSALPVSLHSFSAWALPHEAPSLGRINPSSSSFVFWVVSTNRRQQQPQMVEEREARVFILLASSCQPVFWLWPHPSTKSTTSAGQPPTRTCSYWFLWSSKCSPCPFKLKVVMLFPLTDTGALTTHSQLNKVAISLNSIRAL